jgi:hypothetical protein
LEDLYADGTTVIKWMFRKWGSRVWTESVMFVSTFGFHRRGIIS